jgi:hypothetical protein
MIVDLEGHVSTIVGHDSPLKGSQLIRVYDRSWAHSNCPPCELPNHDFPNSQIFEPNE